VIEMEFRPFYLRNQGDCLVTSAEISKFSKKNPNLHDFVQINFNKFEVYRKLTISELESLCSWIIGQQISVIACESILSKFKKVIPKLTFENLKKVPDTTLMNIGLSKAKVKYIRGLAENLNQHDPKVIKSMELAHQISYFTKIHGIGPWTAKMHLMFFYGHKDIAGYEDLVARKGLKILYGTEEIPSVKESKLLMKNWSPLSTVGTILSWLVVENI
jgi:DNA-3-methyladenine glycosylase II